MSRDRFVPRPATDCEGEPFADAETAWFWYVQCRLAQLDGARVGARAGQVIRPCEPLDVLAVVDRLYRRRRLLREHLEVLADYGRRLLPPDPDSRRERRAAHLWREALGELTPALRAKGIVA